MENSGSSKKPQSSNNDAVSPPLSSVKGFEKEDLKTPSTGNEINIESTNELKALPGETMVDFMVRWMNRHKKNNDPLDPTGVENTETQGTSSQQSAKAKDYGNNVWMKTSFADVVQEKDKQRTVYFCTLETNLSTD